MRKNKLPEEISGLVAGLRWLLDITESTTDKKVIQIAKARKLLKIHNNSHHIKFNGKLAKRYFTKPNKSLLHIHDTELLAHVILTYGEFSRWDSDKFFNTIKINFNNMFFRKHMLAAFEKAAEIINKKSSDLPLQEIGFIQHLSKDHLHWEQFDFARHQIAYGGREFRCVEHGLSAISHILSSLDPIAFCNLVVKNKGKYASSVLVQHLPEKLIFEDPQKIATAFLNCKNNYLVCLGAAAIISPGIDRLRALSLEDAFKYLTVNGLQESTALWMCSIILKDKIHRRYQIDSQLTSAKSEIAFYEKYPEKAGGLQNATNIVEFNKLSIASLNKENIENETSIDETILQIGKCWPASGLSHDEIKYLDSCLVGKGEFRFRIAKEVLNTTDRESLLNINIAGVTNWLDCGKGFDFDSTCGKYFSYDKNRNTHEIFWAAKSCIELWHADSRGIGRNLGTLLYDFDSKLSEFLHLPLMRARKPEKWGSAYGRLAASYLFALSVFENTPEEHEDQIIKIIPSVSEKVKEFISIDNIYHTYGIEELVDDLINTYGRLINSKPYLSPIKEAMLLDSNVPLYLRSLIVWRDNTLRKENGDLAIDLFEKLGEMPLSSKQFTQTLNHWASILDIAIVNIFEENDQASLAKITAVWQQKYPLWKNHFGRDFYELPNILFFAMQSDGDARSQLLAFRGFNNSYCVQKIIGSSQHADHHRN